MNLATIEADRGNEAIKAKRKDAISLFCAAGNLFGKSQDIREEIQRAIQQDPKKKETISEQHLRRDLAKGYYNWGGLEYLEKKYKDALGKLKQAIPFAQQVYEAEGSQDNAVLLGNVYALAGDSHMKLYNVALKHGDVDSAKQGLDTSQRFYQLAQDTLESITSIPKADPNVDSDHRILARLYGSIANLQYQKSAFSEAAAYREKQIAILNALTTQRSRNEQFHDDLGKAHIGLAYARFRAFAGNRSSQQTKKEFNLAYRDTKAYLDSIDDAAAAGRFKDTLPKKLNYLFCNFFKEMIELPEIDQDLKTQMRTQLEKLIEELEEKHPDEQPDVQFRKLFL